MQSNKIVKSILYVRTDEAYNHLNAFSFLKALRDLFPQSSLSVLCEKNLADLYAANPIVDAIIYFEKEKLVEDDSYRLGLASKLKSINFDLAINAIYDREPIADFLTLAGEPKETIGFNGCSRVFNPEDKAKNDVFYTSLINVDNYYSSENERYLQLLKSLNPEAELVDYKIDLANDTVTIADEILRKYGLKSEDTIVCMPFHGEDGTLLKDFENIARHFSEKNFLILCNRPKQNNTAVDLFEKYENVINLCGKTSFLETCGLIKQTAFTISYENEGSYIAEFLDKKNLFISGGGTFGRLTPSSMNTTVAVLPLSCFGCNWNCCYKEKFCLSSFNPDFLIKTIHENLSPTKMDKQIVVVDVIAKDNIDKLPKWKWYNYLISDSEVILASFEQMPDIEDVNSLIDEAELSISEGNFLQARNILTSIITEDSDNIDALNNLAIIEIMEKNYEEASVYLRKVLNIDPTNEVAYSTIGFFEQRLKLYNSLLDSQKLIKDNKLEEAKNILTDMILIDSNYIDALNHLTIIHMMQKDYESAFLKINRVLELDPTNVDAAENLTALKEIQASQSGNEL